MPKWIGNELRQISNWPQEGDMKMHIMRNLLIRAESHYTCLRPPGAAGALILPNSADPSLFVFGYANAPDWSPTCKELGSCEMVDGHCVRTVHAEVNAIAGAARYGITTNGCVMYSLLKPCYECSKVIIQAGISVVYYAGIAYNEDRTNQILKRADVYMEFVDIGMSYGK